MNFRGIAVLPVAVVLKKRKKNLNGMSGGKKFDLKSQKRSCFHPLFGL